MTKPLHETMHRTAKYFMDNGRAKTADEAVALLKSYGLNIAVGPEIQSNAAAQIALLTLVNLARRTFLGGVSVVGLGEAKTLVALSAQPTLASAVLELGGLIAGRLSAAWPTALIGSATAPVETAAPVWRLTWQGWRAGVVPAREGWRLSDDETCPLAPALAAAICTAEAFSFHSGDDALSGKRGAGLSLWQPGVDWKSVDSTEAPITFLPAKLWLIGLGNLGQSYAWLLGCFPYPERVAEIMLQDFDVLGDSNDSTSVLTYGKFLGRRKTRWTSAWMETRGFNTVIDEHRFGAWTKRQADEPGVALCGVDKPHPRGALEQAGFDLVVEAGLGAGPQSFRSFAIHTFPGPRRAADLWPTTLVLSQPTVSEMPAYKDLATKGLDKCGLAQLASRTVGVPFVGLIAGSLAIAEVLRRLNGGAGYGVIAGSTLSLGDVEAGPGSHQVYPSGYCMALRY
nr:hypothetical protein [uncultured Dongia sp.]